MSTDTATATDLRARAREAHRQREAAEAARIERERRQAGRMLRELLWRRLETALDGTPERGTLDLAGIRFTATFDGHDDRENVHAWTLHAACILPYENEYGEARTGDRARIECLADLGGLLAEYEEVAG